MAKNEVEVIDVNAAGTNKNKVRPAVKPSAIKTAPLVPIKQDIVSLFSMTPEALASIVKRWRDSAGHRAIGRAKMKLLLRSPSPKLVSMILSGATNKHDDSDLGGIDSRVLYTELAKCINDEAIAATLDECNLVMNTPEFAYDDGSDYEAGKLSAMWVLHPVFGERVLTIMLRKYKGANPAAALRDAMLAMLKRDPNNLISAILAGRISKQAIAELKTWKNPYSCGNAHSVIWTKIALVRAAVWPDEMLRAVTKDPRSPFVDLFFDAPPENVICWWPTRTNDSKSVYEDRINGEKLHYFDLMLVTSMGAIIDKYDGTAKGMAVIDSALVKLPHASDIYFHRNTWRFVLALAYRHEHMEPIVEHLARNWKGFAKMALSSEGIDWIIDTMPAMRGRMPGIVNRGGKQNRQGRASRLSIMLRLIYEATDDLTVDPQTARISHHLSKWIRTGSLKEPNPASMEAAKQFFLPTAIKGNLINENMVNLAAILKANVNTARERLPALDVDELRGLLSYANTDFTLYLYALDPVYVWSIEYQRAFTNRTRSVQDRIRAMLPAWLLAVTEEKKKGKTKPDDAGFGPLP